MPTPASGSKLRRFALSRTSCSAAIKPQLWVSPTSGCSAELGQALRQVRADVVAHPLDQPLAPDQPQIGQRHRAGHRMAAVGVAVVELATVVDQHRATRSPTITPPSGM